MLAFFVARYLYNLQRDHLATPRRKITEAVDCDSIFHFHRIRIYSFEAQLLLHLPTGLTLKSVGYHIGRLVLELLLDGS